MGCSHEEWGRDASASHMLCPPNRWATKFQASMFCGCTKMDALRIALQLKDQFPQHDIKVGIAKTRNSIEDVKQGSVFH